MCKLFLIVNFAERVTASIPYKRTDVTSSIVCYDRPTSILRTRMVTFLQRQIVQLQLVDDPHCVCPLGELETPDHILYECTNYHRLRERLRDSELVEGVVWRLPVAFWMRKDSYRDFEAPG